MFDTISNLFQATSRRLRDAFPGPAWSMTSGEGPGTLGGDGGAASIQLPADPRPVDPDPGVQHLGGGGRGALQHPDPEARETIAHGDDVTRRLGTRIYWAMSLVHPKVASSLETLIDDILSVPPTLKVAVDPPRRGEDPTPEAELAAQILAECQESIDRLRPSLDDALRQMLESMFVEFSGAAEPVWEAVGEGRKVSYRLRTLATLPREAWEFVVDPFRSVTGYVGRGPDGKPIVLPTSKLGVMTWRPRAGDPRGRAMLRAAYADCDMDWRLRDPYFQHVYNFSDPFRVGKSANGTRQRIPGVDPHPHPGNPNPGQITGTESMAHVLRHAGSAGFAAIGEKDEITTQYPQGAGEAYINAFKFSGDNIVESIVGDLRATQQAAYGSRAAAEVGERVKGVRVQSGRRLVCGVLGEILRTQNELNHGPDVAARLTPYVLMQAAEQGPSIPEWTAGGWRMNDTTHQAEVDGKVGLTPREIGTEESTENRTAQAQIFAAYVDGGIPPRLAAKRAGWTDEELVELDKALGERKAAEAKMLADQPVGAGTAAEAA